MSTRIQCVRNQPCNARATNCWPQRFVVVLVMIIALAHHAVYAADFGGIGAAEGSRLEQQFKEIDRELFLELVKLAKFNIHLHLEANRHQPWRALTYPVFRESGTAVGFAATLSDITQQARGIENLANVSRGQLKNAVRCGITGSAISGSASALELAQNSWVMLKARQKGYSPARSLSF